MNNSKTILAVVLLMAGTLLLTITAAVTTMVTAAYAGGDNDDGNKNLAEDESQASIADCDENNVEQAGFDCIVIAANDVEIATLSVCKEVDPTTSNFLPDDFVCRRPQGGETQE